MSEFTMVMPLNRAEILLTIISHPVSTPSGCIEHLQSAIYEAEDASICNDVFIELDTEEGRWLRQVAETNHVYHVIH